MKYLKGMGMFVIVLIMSVMMVSCGDNKNNNNNENNNGGVNPLVEYTVTFKIGESVYETRKVNSGSKVEKPKIDPTKTNKVFIGWYNGEIQWDFTENVVTENMILVAKFIDEYDAEGYKVIATKEQLIDYASNVENYIVNARLYSDIDLGGMEWIPIASTVEMDEETEELKNVYSAIFDGNGYIIKNYKISKYSIATGFFGFTNNATICNLDLSDFTIDITDDNCKGVYIGGLIGGIFTQVNVVNCSTKGNINLVVNNGDYFQGAFVGGLIGATLWGAYGGLVVENSYSMVNINYQGVLSMFCNSFGGLIGMYSALNSIVNNCYATGNINVNLINNELSGAYSYVGGLIGKENDLIKIQNSYATGNINVMYSGDENVYIGLVSTGRAVFENCYRYNEQIISSTNDCIICEEGTSADIQTIWGFVANTWDSEIWNFYSDKNPTLK